MPEYGYDSLVPVAKRFFSAQPLGHLLGVRGRDADYFRCTKGMAGHRCPAAVESILLGQHDGENPHGLARVGRVFTAVAQVGSQTIDFPEDA